MKIAITSRGNSLDSILDRRFGRCEYFVIYDTAGSATEFIKNINADSVEGAGVASARVVASKGVSKVVSGEFGNKVKNIFSSMEIDMMTIDEDMTISQIIDSLK